MPPTGISAAMFAPTAAGVAAMLVPPERRGFALSVVAAGKRDLSSGCRRILLCVHALGECDRLADTGPKLIESCLIVIVSRRLLSSQPLGRSLARDLWRHRNFGKH